MTRHMRMANQEAMIGRDPSPTETASGELTIPYWFSSVAQERGENLNIADYVRVQGLDNQYELLDIFPRFGSVRIRAVGERECLVFPWRFVEPCEKPFIESKTVMQGIGDWLFRGNRVYMLSEPDRMLTTKRINWDKETSDVEDEDGQVFYDVPWDSLEFWDPVEFHFPDDE